MEDELVQQRRRTEHLVLHLSTGDVGRSHVFFSASLSFFSETL